MPRVSGRPAGSAGRFPTKWPTEITAERGAWLAEQPPAVQARMLVDDDHAADPLALSARTGASSTGWCPPSTTMTDRCRSVGRSPAVDVVSTDPLAVQVSETGLPALEDLRAYLAD